MIELKKKKERIISSIGEIFRYMLTSPLTFCRVTAKISRLLIRETKNCILEKSEKL